MAVNRLHPQVPLKYTNKSITVYGKYYGFDPSNPHDKARATMEAEQYGFACQKALEQRLQRPLSVREQISGQPDPEPAEKHSGSLRVPEDPDRNPYDSRLADVAKWSELTSDQRVRKARRIEQYQRASEDWQRNREKQKAEDARRTDPAFLRAKQHAEQRAEELKLRGDVTQADVDRATDAVRALEDGRLSAGGYFNSIQQPLPSPGGDA